VVCDTRSHGRGNGQRLVNAGEICWVGFKMYHYPSLKTHVFSYAARRPCPDFPRTNRAANLSIKRPLRWAVAAIRQKWPGFQVDTCADGHSQAKLIEL